MTPAAMAALVEVINAPTRPPALRSLARIKYPGRELQPRPLPDGAIQFTLRKWGFQYKAYPRTKNQQPADPAAIQAALNTVLAPRFIVRNVTDREPEIIITLEEKR